MGRSKPQKSKRSKGPSRIKQKKFALYPNTGGMKAHHVRLVLPKRIRVPPDRLAQGPVGEAGMVELDEEIGTDPMPEDFEDDFEWLPRDPGRPPPYSNTWNLVYGQRTLNKAKRQYEIYCGEPGCGAVLLMDSKLKEINAGSTPHGMPRKPPVCHDVPWAALKVALEDLEHKQTTRRKRDCKLTDEFKRAVCWHVPNLHPGHNACNAAGAKTTAANVSAKELRDAERVIATVQIAWGKSSIWVA